MTIYAAGAHCNGRNESDLALKNRARNVIDTGPLLVPEERERVALEWIEFVKDARRKRVIGEEPIAHVGRAGLAELIPELERQRRWDRNGASDVTVVWDRNGAHENKQDALAHSVGVIAAKVIDDYRERLRLPSQGVLRKLPQI